MQAYIANELAQSLITAMAGDDNNVWPRWVRDEVQLVLVPKGTSPDAKDAAVEEAKTGVMVIQANNQDEWAVLVFGNEGKTLYTSATCSFDV